MPGVHRVRATLLACALGASASACAAIWGFQSGIEESEAGSDAPTVVADQSVEATDGAESSNPAAVDAHPEADATVTPDASDASRPDGESGVDSTSDRGVDSPADAAADAASDVDAASDADAAPPDAGRDGTGDSATGIDAGCACVTAIPAGWAGPYAIYEGMGGPPPPTPPSCAGSYPNELYNGNAAPSAPAANCSCNCGSPTGTTCGAPVANYYTDTGCTAQCGQANQPIGTTCTNLDPCSWVRLTFSAPIPSGGTCAPDASSSVPTAGWTADVRLCATASQPTAAGCDAGQVCTPAAIFPFEAATYCIAHSGSASCPPGYPASRTYYQSSTDTRACTTCTCGTATNVSCSSASVWVYYAGCGLGYGIYGAPQSCVNTQGAGGAIAMGTSTPSGGTCAPMGGTATGSFTPTTPTTICCTQ